MNNTSDLTVEFNMQCLCINDSTASIGQQEMLPDLIQVAECLHSLLPMTELSGECLMEGHLPEVHLILTKL